MAHTHSDRETGETTAGGRDGPADILLPPEGTITHEQQRPGPDHPRPGCTGLDQELFADFAELRAERQRTDQAIDAWATTVTAQSFGEPLRYVSGGRQREYPLWWVVMHLFNHQTHHRGQITTLLLQAGQDPGSTDLLAMLMEEETAGADALAVLVDPARRE